MQLGPVRLAVDARSQTTRRALEHRSSVRDTTFIKGARVSREAVDTAWIDEAKVAGAPTAAVVGL
jgi:hypothetical protein